MANPDALDILHLLVATDIFTVMLAVIVIYVVHSIDADKRLYNQAIKTIFERLEKLEKQR
jgi:hypothetical protein